MKALQSNFESTPIIKPLARLYSLQGSRGKHQEETLRKMLHLARHTEFGMVHDFKSILNAENLLEAFQANVPLTNYEKFHEQWLGRALKAETDLIWPGVIKYFALSSGTTKGGSKYIPVSDHMLRQFKRTSFQQITELSGVQLTSSLIKSKALIIGGSTELQTMGDVRVGDLSGILAKNKSWIYTSISKPGRKISKLKDWEIKMDRIVERAPSWNIGVIAGVPSWVNLLLERIIKHHQLSTIHEIWPNFQLYVHGGVFIEPYKSKIEKMCGRPLVYQNTYLASEGYFGYQKEIPDNTMTLLPKHGIFYEFVEAKDFEALRYGMLDTLKPKLLSEVQPDVSYAMVITTCSGLWRYHLGDVIVFKDVNKLKFKIIGRISYNLNICGEHLSEENISKAILDTGKRYGIEIQEFCAYPNQKKDRHEWYIGVDRAIPESDFEAYLDESLKLLNDDYGTARKFILKRPKVKALPIQKFYEYMALNHRIGAQSKFPRVLNEPQIKDWESFLSNVNAFLNESF